jgi:hypothetical protein
VSESGGGMPVELIQRVVDRLTEDELRRARSALTLTEDADRGVIAEALERYSEAALVEYLDQFLGRALPTRYKDLQMLRLLRISLHANEGQLLAPDRVAELFQITHAEAKTLVRNTATRYRFELEGKLIQVAWDTLVATGREEADGYKVEIRDAALLEFLHDLVRRGPGYPKGIQPSQEMHVFSLDLQTMEALLPGLGHTKAELDQTLAQS